MRLIWNGKDRYRAFCGAPNRKLSLVSSHISQASDGRTIGGIFLLVRDTEDRFCDFELTLDPRFRKELLPLPNAPKIAFEDLELEISDYDRVAWNHDQSKCLLQVAFCSVMPMRWVRLGENALWIGVDSNDYVAEIVCEGVLDDPSGEAESAWIDEIEGRAHAKLPERTC